MKTPEPTPAPRFLGIEIGGTKLQLVVGTSTGEIVHRKRFTVDSERGAESIREHIQHALPELLSSWAPQAIGVGYGGPVNWRTGQIVKSYHVPGWHNFPLGQWLSEHSGLPVFVENDANVAALGEALHGAGRDCDPVFYITIGSGVGGGLVHEGRILHGFTGGEAEVGHLWLDTKGLRPEDCCSGWALDRIIRGATIDSPDSDLARRVAADPGHETRHLGGALAAGDRLAERILDETTEHLAQALSHVTHLCHPEVLILGGGVSLLGEPFRAAVARHHQRMVMDAFQPGPRIVLAALREDSVPVGALALASQRLQTHSNLT